MFRFEQKSFLRVIGRFAKSLILWIMLFSGIFLATRQAEAISWVAEELRFEN